MKKFKQMENDYSFVKKSILNSKNRMIHKIALMNLINIFYYKHSKKCELGRYHSLITLLNMTLI